ncbi:MAG: helix-turn-helix transcriptional regulator [Lachnospiraceae bacterium]|nr:helix-turn-helix transcriptional regulator [Lachnospiraceae bacterium]
MKERPEYDLEKTGEQFKRLREKNGLSVEEVRKYMKLASLQSIYKWEYGKNFPSADNLLALAELYGVRAEDMLVKIMPKKPKEEAEKIMLFGMQGMDYEVSA